MRGWLALAKADPEGKHHLSRHPCHSDNGASRSCSAPVRRITSSPDLVSVTTRDGSRSDRMTERVTPRRRGSYGIDAPFIDAFLAGLVVLYLVLAIVTGRARFWLAFLFI